MLASALILVIMTLGLLDGLDSSSAMSATLRSQAVAANLAQQDQDRLRSLLASDLSNRNEHTTHTVAGQSYDVWSLAQWVSDATGDSDCTSTAAADYLKITSSVTWANMGSTQPVTDESLVAPPNGSFSSDEGSMGVQVNGGDGSGVDGVNVTATGPANVSTATNSQGCALLGHLPVGEYQLTVSRDGYVSRQGDPTATVQSSVIAQTTNTASFDYAPGASLQASFDTAVGGGAPQPANTDVVTVANSGLAAPFTRQFGTAGQMMSTLSVTSLFPFADPYAVYAGDCSDADPRKYGQQAAMVVASGPSQPVTLRLPAINLTVTRGGAPLAGAHVRFVPAGTGGCSESYTRTTDAQGHLTEPGLPYGDWAVCADNGSYFAKIDDVANHDPAGSAPASIAVPTSGSGNQGKCL